MKTFYEKGCIPYLYLIYDVALYITKDCTSPISLDMVENNVGKYVEISFVTNIHFILNIVQQNSMKSLSNNLTKTQSIV